MIARNAAQFRAIIRNRAKSANLPAQTVMQQYMLERLLMRASMSPYRTNVILKGGFLISAITGIEARTTMDMDVTLTGMPLLHSSVTNMFKSFCRIDADDGITFSLVRTEDIRKDDIYSGLRVHLKAVMDSFDDMKVPAVDLTVDVTTGDAITPKQMEFAYPPVFKEDSVISCLAYPVATIIAEKVETILWRAEDSTRPRDFYDVHILYRLHRPHSDELRLALENTCAHRETASVLEHPKSTIEEFRNSEPLARRWDNYQRKFPYAQGISFADCCDTLDEIIRDCALN